MQSVQSLPADSQQCWYLFIMTIQSSVVSIGFNIKISLLLDHWVSVHYLMWQMCCWGHTPWSTIATFLPYLNPLHLIPSVIHSPQCLKLHCASEHSLINTNYNRQSPEKLTSPQLVKKFPAFYGTRRFITLFIKRLPPVPNLNQINPVQASSIPLL